MVDVWNNCAANVPLVAQEESFRLYNRDKVLMKVFDGFVPKHHLVYHLLAKTSLQENQKGYDTWLSGSPHKLLKGHVNMPPNILLSKRPWCV